jgi:hypothetical protein
MLSSQIVSEISESIILEKNPSQPTIGIVAKERKVVAIPNTDAEWRKVLLCLPNRAPEPVGILLLNRKANKLALKLKSEIATEDDAVAEVWCGLADDLRRKSREYGGNEVVDWLEDTLSMTFRLSDSCVLLVEGRDLDQQLDQLYSTHVEHLFSGHLAQAC